MRMRLQEFFRQLAQRRVVRTAGIYVAAAWIALQVADLLAGASIISDAWVRWLIVAAVAGLPIALGASWFLEAPWKSHGRTRVLGDLFVILAIAGGALALAWQRWMISTTRVPVAIGEIVATDLQSDTAALARHLEERFALLLDADETAAIVLHGTMARGGDRLRLSIRLEDREARPLWGDSFDGALIELGELQLAVVDTLAREMASIAASSSEAKSLLADCRYPSNGAAIIALAGEQPEALDEHIRANADNGLLHLRQSQLWYAAMQEAPAPQKPVLFALVTQALDSAAAACPGYAPIETARIAYTRSLGS